LFVGSKPMVSHFRVFGCPCIAKKWTISVDGKPEDNSKGMQRGIRGIHLGFSRTQKGLLRSETVPQIVDDGLDANTRRSNRTRNPPKLLTFKNFQAARNWQEMANKCV
jgi:hypothetical protein